MAAKNTSRAVLMLGILLFAFLGHAARPALADPEATTQLPLAAAEERMEAAGDRCGGDDDCMMRRTLEAHLDYIYTQEKKH